MANRRHNDLLSAIVTLVRPHLELDFDLYKRGALTRCIERRMNLAQLERLADYLDRLQGDAAEITALCKDLSIGGGTGFFRDPEAWQALEHDVLQPLVAAKAPGAPIRAWVPGCTTGEEVFSIAMLLIEQLQAVEKNCSLQIFGTDTDTAALEAARVGVYSESIATGVSASCLRRFFIPVDHGFRVSKELREAVIFAAHNLITDPPLSRMDLISCRHLLSCWKPRVQKKLVSLFHFALVEGGYLFLGGAESLGQQADLFKTLSKRWRLYQSIGSRQRALLPFPVVPKPKSDLETKTVAPDLDRAGSLVKRILLERFAPASVVLNRRHEILDFSGPIDAYLAHPPGEPIHEQVARARTGLQTTLRAAVTKAFQEHRSLTLHGHVRRGKLFRDVRVMVEPLHAPMERSDLLLVSFTDESDNRTPALAVPPPPAFPSSADEGFARELEYELVTTREDLQTTIAQLESSTEQMTASEQALSSNEGLQRGDALFDGAPAGITLVDDQGRILSANAQMEKLFGYRRDELIGRPIETLVPVRFRDVHVGHRTGYGTDPQAREMGRGRDLTAMRKDGSEFPVEVGLGPLRTQDGLLVAAYVTDISARKQAEAALRAAHEELEQRVLERTAQLRAINDRLAELSNRILTLQDEERRRIGRELHDSTAQTLAAVAMNLTLLERKAGAGLDASAQRALNESVALVGQCAREIRTVAYLLHPPFLDEVGLVAAVHWYAEGLAKRSGISVQVDASPKIDRLPREVETALFRIVQECLTNAHRHSKSSTVRLRLARNASTITLRVEDSGRGITPDILQALAHNDTRTGMGIVGMQERMRHLGGQLEITSGNDGTVMLATLPLSAVRQPPQAADA